MDEKPHHHGNLRAALIDAGMQLLAERGLDGLTLRRAAAKAGVSHAAPAHHFNGKQGLVLAIAAHGFQTFTQLMQDERYRHGDTPQDQLLGICEGYLRFAREHTALFRLIFTTEVKSDPDEDLQTASAAAFGLLVEVCALFEPSPEGDGVNEIMMWSLVHGYAGLSQFSHLNNPSTGEVIPFAMVLPKLKPKTGERITPEADNGSVKSF